MKLSCFRLGLAAAALLVIPAAYADELKPGAKAPDIKVAEWVKGKPFKSFADSEFTVVEFWATWCGPCIDAIPHITELSKKHKGKVSFYGVSVWENGDDIPAAVKKFVADMGDKMDYNVARDNEEGFMAKNWMEAASQNGIPASFLIDKTGKVLWVGHPMSLDSVLEQAVEGKFDLDQSIKQFDEEATAVKKQRAMMQQAEDAKKLYAEGKKEEALAKLDAIEAGNDMNLIIFKKMTRLEMFLDDPARANAFIDELVKEKKPENVQVLVQLSFMLKKEASKEQKAIVERGLTEGLKLDPKGPITHLNVGYGWIQLGNKEKALEVLLAGEKLLADSPYKDDAQLKKIFADMIADAKIRP